MDIRDFTSVPMTESTQKLAKEIADKYFELAGLILRTTSPTPHRTAALRLLLDSKMTMIHDLSHR